MLGTSGMLGSTFFRIFSSENNFETFGTLRQSSGARYFADEWRNRLIPNVHLESENGLINPFLIAKPDIVINCVGIIKQSPGAGDRCESIAINSILPHRIAKLSKAAGARLIHFSTDCVFSGKVGQYREDDFPDAGDLYGRSKLLGEVEYDNSVTLRTSIIGHELSSSKSLVDWFLSQKGPVKGYRKAIFSGLPAVEIVRVVKELIIANPGISGLYHLSVDPISKFDLLNLVAEAYEKKIVVVPDDHVVIDRSLNSDRLRAKIGFTPAPWRELVEVMRRDRLRQESVSSS